MISAIRPRAGLVPAWLLVLAPIAWGQEPPKPADDPNPLRELTVSPADAPIPAMKYRLIPRPADLNPGNAAPLYLRIRHELNSEYLKKIDELAGALDKPLAEFPRDEVRELMSSSRLRQIEFGARRQTCDWGFSLPEQRKEVINMLLPDTQEMRRWARLLALKVRLEVAEGKTEEAIRTLETAMAFGRHVGKNPFLIGGLVGIAIESVMLNRMEELIVQPGSPNLYWALTDLPRPLIDLRDQLSVEERMGEDMVPELNETDDPRSPAEWAALLSRMHANMVNLAGSLVSSDEMPASVKTMMAQDVAAFRKSVLDEAKAYFRTRRGLTDDQIQAMSEDQIVATFIAGRYREVRDDMFKLSNLAFLEALEAARQAEEQCKTLRNGPLAIFGEMFPSTISARISTTQLDRRVAAYRTLEALRIHAARHDGALPRSLADVKEVPIPLDPATGKPFEYKLDGKSAILFAPLIENRPKNGVNWRITIR